MKPRITMKIRNYDYLLMEEALNVKGASFCHSTFYRVLGLEPRRFKYILLHIDTVPFKGSLRLELEWEGPCSVQKPDDPPYVRVTTKYGSAYTMTPNARQRTIDLLDEIGCHTGAHHQRTVIYVRPEWEGE